MDRPSPREVGAPTTPHLHREGRVQAGWDRRPLLAEYADKIAARDVVARTVGPQYLSELLAVASDPRDLDLAALSTRYVVKPSHGSGAVIVVHDQADPDLRLPELPDDRGWTGKIAWIRPEHLDRARFDAMCDLWLRHDYWRALGSTECAYKDVPHRLMGEEFLEGDGHSARDLKFHVAHGRVSWFHVNLIREPTTYITCFDRRGEVIPVRYVCDPAPEPIALPDNLDEMIRIAEALGTDTDIVRVDLYDVGGRIVFGELTNYPAGGRACFDPPEYDEILGADWHPPRHY
ncbi:MAG: ATP-grasp fold amidoligase family protein [Actinomycetota bacterium]